MDAERWVMETGQIILIAASFAAIAIAAKITKNVEVRYETQAKHDRRPIDKILAKEAASLPDLQTTDYPTAAYQAQPITHQQPPIKRPVGGLV